MTAEVGEDASSPVVPAPLPLGEESRANRSDNERVFNDDVWRTSWEVSFAVSCGGGVVIVELWKSAGRLIARGK